MEFCNVLDDFFLVQKNHVTRDTSNSGSHGNILDLVLTNAMMSFLVHLNAFDSHHPLTFLRKQGQEMLNLKCYRTGDF